MSESFPYKERIKKPYVLLLDPETGRGALYDAQHRLMAEAASPNLVEFARKHATACEPWNDERDKHFPRPRTVWMPTGSLQGWVLYWLRDSRSSDEHLRATPDR